MKREDVDTFEKLKGQLDGLYQEMSVLSKKSPNDAVNKFKIQLINLTLADCNRLLGKTYLPFPSFTEFSSDDLPSNSDVSFILAQYLECAEKFRADHIVNVRYHEWFWLTDDVSVEDDDWENGILTTPPKKLAIK